MIQHNGNALRVCGTTPKEAVLHLAYDKSEMTRCDQHVSHFTMIPVRLVGVTSDVEWCQKCCNWLNGIDEAGE